MTFINQGKVIAITNIYIYSGNGIQRYINFQ